ncbi:hypothetical protein LSCM4_02629 [Leishmania orientalis]|uniref:Uncharacterized protein n=1 Tax=Leishmania orientalis TaxID=2249476 RepID=A0A836G6Y2_9TRYP|nr:hypothetical protein LSCM4_02629 [Leishmania orientalis]
MYGRADCTPMEGKIHPQHMEWLMQQGMQGIPHAATSRAYHLEPMPALQPRQQHGSLLGVTMGQQPGGGVMGGISAYGPGPMIGGVHGGHTSLFPTGATAGAAYGVPSVHGAGLTGYGAAGCALGVGEMQNAQSLSPALFAAGCTANSSEWNNANFSGIFNSAVDPKIQLAVAANDQNKPLPFPPGNLLAQYPTEYQQQLIFYYRLLRLQYPELYQQYVDYYEMYYEPLYHPQQSPPTKDDARPKKPKTKPRPPPQELTADMQRRPPEKLQPVHQSPSPVEPPKTPNNVPRTASNLSGVLKRQSSLRRQNSMRRNEVNQMKNEGGLKRLPSMRQQ